MSDKFTADVANGKIRELAAFALHCSRVLGECSQSLIEDSGGSPTDYPYSPQAVADAKAQLEAFLGMNPAESLALFMFEREAETREAATRIAIARQSRQRYEALLSQVDRQKSTLFEWDVCCRFLIDILEAAIARECDTRYWERKLAPVAYDQWRKSRVRKLRREISLRKSFLL